MLIAPSPSNEADRLQLLRSLGVIDTPAEEVFDRITRVLAQMLQVPIALVSLIDENRQWFKSKVGLSLCETPRDIAFCAHALEGSDVMVVEDTMDDPRFFSNPLVLGFPYIRFYAGVPLRSHEGLIIGTLCAIDTQPRTLKPEAIEALKDLAAIVQQELLQRCMTQDLQGAWEGERSARALSELRFEAVFRHSPTGKAIIDLKGQFIAVSPKLCEITGYDEPNLLSKSFKEITHPDDLSQDLAHVAKLLSNRQKSYSLEKRYLHKSGQSVWVELNVALVRNDLGNPDHYIAVVLDISKRKQHEALLRQHQEVLEAKVIERTQELSRNQKTLQVIADNLPILIAQVDCNLCYRFNNEVYRQIFGLSPASLLGKPISSVLHPDLFKRLQPYFQRALAGERVTCEAIPYSLEQNRLWSSTYIPDVRNGEVVGFFVMSHDVTERIKLERSLLDKALLDPLTELPNRRALQEQLQYCVQPMSRQQIAFTLFFMDMDGFKAVNDEYGHEIGDALLCQIASRLKANKRKDDFVCRLAGDEFVVIANGIANKADAQDLAELLIKCLSKPFSIGTHLVHVGISVGIALCPVGKLVNAEALLRQADDAMYKAKRQGRNGYRFALDL